MNQDSNLQIVQTMYTAFSRGNIDQLLANMDESVTWIVPGSEAVPMSGMRRGRAQVRQFFQDLSNRIEFNVFEPREFIAQGNRVVALIHYEGRDKMTNRTFNADSAMVWTLANGKAIRFQEYTDTEAFASAAAGSSQARGAV